MLKGILICCGVLFAQLVLLHYVDHRVNGGRTEVRYTQTNPSQANVRQRDGQLVRREENEDDSAT